MFEPPKLSWIVLDRVDVDARRRDVGAEPVERQHRRREERASCGSPATLKALRIVWSI